jgi:hypothetical protein
MMIWKYSLKITDFQTLSMPVGAKVLSLHLQHGCPQLWALVDEGGPQELRTFTTIGTGNPIPSELKLGAFIGTYLARGDAVVFHVFEVEPT